MDLEFKDRLFEGQSKRDIEDNLQALADTVYEDFSFEKDFSSEEISQMKEDVSMFTMEVEERKDEIKAFSAPLKMEIKSKETQRKVLLKQIRKGTYEVAERVYMFQDPERLLAHIYDRHGERINTRPLTMEERKNIQMRLHPVSVLKTGTEN
jgi:hypothetical protein